MSTEPQKPERLWKYRSLAREDDLRHAYDMITHGELHYSQLETLNDPFEVSWCIRLPNKEAELDEFSRELCAMTFPYDLPHERYPKFLNMKQSVRDLVTKYKSNIVPSFVTFELGLMCFAEINHDVLMWSHYADHHRGICVGIRTDRVQGKRFLKVTYSDDVPLLDCWDYINRHRDLFVNASRTKGLHWRYEEEW